jgi:hypothetical protein
MTPGLSSLVFLVFVYLFVFFFQVGFPVFAQALDCHPPTYVSCLTGMTGMHHYVQLVG